MTGGLVLPPSLEEAVGCQQCQQGTKLVLFVTGRCHWGCAYCPLSENRRESPVMYANERPCTTWSEVLEEARAMDATGTGITGGDPMLDLERSLDAIRELKGAFGHAHHIHLYTSIPIEPDVAQRLADAGLDELRFHLLDLNLDRYRASLAGAVDAGLVTGIELPAQPDQVHALEALIEDLRDEPIAFLNLNELEITVGNQEQMDVRGFNLGSGLGAAAAGSADLAIRLRDRVLAAALGQPDPFDDVPRAPYGYHLKFCTASFKDAGQLRARFRRRAEVTLRPYETVSEDDTIQFGAIPVDPSDVEEDLEELIQELGLHPEWVRYDDVAHRIELPLDIAESIAPMLEVPIGAVEVHPTHERLEIGLVWLNEHRAGRPTASSNG